MLPICQRIATPIHLYQGSEGLPDGVSFAIGLALGAVMAGLFGVLIGVPALRLTGDYLALSLIHIC